MFRPATAIRCKVADNPQRRGNATKRLGLFVLLLGLVGVNVKIGVIMLARDDSPPRERKNLLEQWVATLQAEDAAVRCDAARRLGEARSQTAVPALIRALSDRHPTVRA